jgi:hypothetical protein
LPSTLPSTVLIVLVRLVVCVLLLQVRAAGAWPGARILALLNLVQLWQLAASYTAAGMRSSRCPAVIALLLHAAAACSMRIMDAMPAVLLLKQWPLITHGRCCC